MHAPASGGRGARTGQPCLSQEQLSAPPLRAPCFGNDALTARWESHSRRRADSEVEPPRCRADVATRQCRVDGVGRLKFDFHTGGAEKMLRFFRPWGNKDPDAAPAPTRPGRAAFRQSPRAQGFGGGRGDDGDY